MVIFTGDEPHLYAPRYAKAFFDVYKALGVRRGVAVGGVYGHLPYDKDRHISCSYSLRSMKEELDKYALRFSNYEGGTTIGSYFVDRAERQQLEFMVLNALVPLYEFGVPSHDYDMLPEDEFQEPEPHGIRVENDYRAWYDVMLRLNHMFGLNIDLSELSAHSREQTAEIGKKLDELDSKMPELGIARFLAKIAEDFEELSFMPLDELWEEELGDIFGDLE